MARRLPVVLAQSPVASVERRSLEEELATLLMLERGLDVTVIPHLPDLQGGSTGLLCLEGIQGAMVLLCWLAPQEAIEVLRQHGISGRLGRTRITTAAPQSQGDPSERRIHGIDLREADGCDVLVKEICRLRDEAQVQTVTLGGTFTQAHKPANEVRSPSGSPAGESESAALAAQTETEDPNKPAAGDSAHSRPVEAGPRAEGQKHPPGPTSSPSSNSPATHDAATSADDAAEDDEALEAELDDLLDQFDQLKW